jgi:hypothetical protein
MLAGSLFLGCVTIGVAATVYRLFWRSRYGRPFSSSTTRLRGRVSRGVEPPGLLEVRAAGGVCHLVDLSGVLAPRLRPGDRVTLDGLPALLPSAEALYRSPACRSGLAALRLARGTWPELRILDLVLVVALVGAGCTLPRVLKRPAPLDAFVCPPGTRHGSADHIEWCELEREWKAVGGQDAVKHGPWRISSDTGGLRQRGEFARGQPHGEWTTWHSSGRMAERGQYVEGRRDGLWLRWNAAGQPLPRLSYYRGVVLVSLDGEYWRTVDAGLSPQP